MVRKSKSRRPATKATSRAAAAGVPTIPKKRRAPSLDFIRELLALALGGESVRFSAKQGGGQFLDFVDPAVFLRALSQKAKKTTKAVQKQFEFCRLRVVEYLEPAVPGGARVCRRYCPAFSSDLTPEQIYQAILQLNEAETSAAATATTTTTPARGHATTTSNKRAARESSSTATPRSSAKRTRTSATSTAKTAAAAAEAATADADRAPAPATTTSSSTDGANNSAASAGAATAALAPSGTVAAAADAAAAGTAAADSAAAVARSFLSDAAEEQAASSSDAAATAAASPHGCSTPEPATSAAGYSSDWSAGSGYNSDCSAAAFSDVPGLASPLCAGLGEFTTPMPPLDAGVRALAVHLPLVGLAAAAPPAAAAAALASPLAAGVTPPSPDPARLTAEAAAALDLVPFSGYLSSASGATDEPGGYMSDAAGGGASARMALSPAPRLEDAAASDSDVEMWNSVLFDGGSDSGAGGGGCDAVPVKKEQFSLSGPQWDPFAVPVTEYDEPEHDQPSTPDMKGAAKEEWVGKCGGAAACAPAAAAMEGSGGGVVHATMIMRLIYEEVVALPGIRGTDLLRRFEALSSDIIRHQMELHAALEPEER